MKRITLILDGSADRPNAALMNKTPLAAANTPNLDALAQKATKLLRVKTIPDGLEVGSAVANMGLLGLDPHMYRGRAALEAAGLWKACSRRIFSAHPAFLLLSYPADLLQR